MIRLRREGLIKRTDIVELREVQRKAISWVRGSSKRFLFLNAETGSGKSLIGLESFYPEPIFYLCSSKALQDQIEHDFKVEVLKGRSNYRCSLNDEYTVEDCPKKVIEWQVAYESMKYGQSKEFVRQKYLRRFNLKESDLRSCLCPYRIQKQRVEKSLIGVLNYHVFFYNKNYSYLGDEGRVIIVDEADQFEEALADFVSIDVSYKFLRKYTLPIPEKIQSMREFRRWSEEVFKVIKQIQRVIEQNLTELDEEYHRFYYNLILIWTIMDKLKEEFDRRWMFYNDIEGEKVKVRPIWLDRELVEEIFFRHGRRFLFMSATLPAPQVFARMLGINDDEYDYMDLEYVLGKKTIVVKNSYKLNKDNSSNGIEIVKPAIRELLIRHATEKGLILTTTNKLAKEISSSFSGRCLYVDASNYQVQFEKHKGGENTVMVTASFWRGIDLRDDLARFIIITKVPFPDLGDRLIQKRAYSGKFGHLWYVSQAVLMLIQGSGRGVRHEKDYCTVYILDGYIMELLKNKQYQKLFPKSWLKLVTYEF